MSPDPVPVRFIGREVEVEFARPPLLSKKPEAPQAFRWEGARYSVVEVLARWFDFERKGRASKNMEPAHLRAAVRRGSWGVGRYYFRVRTDCGRMFDLYYDRAPESAADRGGHWFLWRELK